jgi:hypothetical protein
MGALRSGAGALLATGGTGALLGALTTGGAGDLLAAAGGLGALLAGPGALLGGGRSTFFSEGPSPWFALPFGGSGSGILRASEEEGRSALGSGALERGARTGGGGGTERLSGGRGIPGLWERFASSAIGHIDRAGARKGTD